MKDASVKCAHCNGTGTCKAPGETSCGFCLAFAKQKLGNSRAKLDVVPCGSCRGVGMRFLNAEYHHELSLAAVMRPTEQGLPAYHINKEEETKRTFDKHRFYFAIFAIFAGIIIFLVGVLSKQLEIIWRVALPIFTGVIGYYLGGKTSSQLIEKFKRLFAQASPKQ